MKQGEKAEQFISQRVISKNQELENTSKNTKEVLCCWRCRGRCFRLVCSVHRARNFRVSHDSRQKFWLSFPDFSDAQDQQLVQHRLN